VIALQHIQFDEGRIELSGVARSSQDVPAWVSRFAETVALANKPFAGWKSPATVRAACISAAAPGAGAAVSARP
jgi:Tfp pilus assembly protein PilN